MTVEAARGDSCTASEPVHEAVSARAQYRGGVPHPPVSGEARTVQRRVALTVIALPFVATVVAVAWAFRDGIEPWELVLLASTYSLTMFGITAGFHRHFAHRAFLAPKPVRVLLAILGSMGAQGPLLFWVTIHRRHHAYSDSLGDPHSPNLNGHTFGDRLRGLWHAHIGWMFVADVSDWGRFARDLAQQRYLVTLHQLYPLWIALGLGIPSVIGGLVTGTWLGMVKGLLWGGLVRIFLVNQISWSVGSFCHMFGRRPFRTGDRSGNLLWVALLMFGEGLHNNHHAFPSSAIAGLNWWEPDLNGRVIRLLERLGLAWNVKVPSSGAQAAARAATRGWIPPNKRSNRRQPNG